MRIKLLSLALNLKAILGGIMLLDLFVLSFSGIDLIHAFIGLGIIGSDLVSYYFLYFLLSL